MQCKAWEGNEAVAISGTKLRTMIYRVRTRDDEHFWVDEETFQPIEAIYFYKLSTHLAIVILIRFRSQTFPDFEHHFVRLGVLFASSWPSAEITDFLLIAKWEKNYHQFQLKLTLNKSYNSPELLSRNPFCRFLHYYLYLQKRTKTIKSL